MYWLFELNNQSQLSKDENKDYVLFTFIAPRNLTEKEKVRLNDFVGNDDIYVEGVKKGWSILFFGYARKYIIKPGICNREDLINEAPESLKNNEDGIIYYNLDETEVFN